MIGELERSGAGVPTEVDIVKSVDALQSGCGQSNQALLQRLRQDEYAVELLEITRADAAKGRLTSPVPAREFDLENVRLHPRFAATKRKADGSVKIRAVDHFSWSEGGKAESVNGHTHPCEKFMHETLDHLASVMALFVSVVKVMCRVSVHAWLSAVTCFSHQEIPGLWKADVDSAFRRIPVRPEHRWACGIVFLAGSQVCSPFSCANCVLRCFCFICVVHVRSAPGVPLRRDSVRPRLGAYWRRSGAFGARSVVLAASSLRG